MKSILVLSDIHSDFANNLSKTKEIMEMCDMILFSGDGYVKLVDFMKKNGIDQSKLTAVCGNCDGASYIASEKTFNIEGVSVLLTHGHQYCVKSGTSFLKEMAKEMKCKLVVFGHTHIYNYSKESEIVFLNSGAIEGCRGNMECTYALLTISGDKISAVKMFC